MRQATRSWFLTSVAMALVMSSASGQVITTIAGTDFSFPLANQQALNAPLGIVSGLARDAAGNMFVADPSNNVVARIAIDGTLSVVAGNRIAGFSGDGGAAINASLNAPFGVALDSAGNLYISDTNNQRIRKVSNGTIMTIAGNGNQGFSGDGEAAINASLSMPSGIAVDSDGSVYIIDTYNERVRRILNGTITTFAGSGKGQIIFAVKPNMVVAVGFAGDDGPAVNAEFFFYGPVGLAVDSRSNLYIADQGNNRIRKVSNGIVTTVAGTGNFLAKGGFSGDGGPAISAELDKPMGVAADSGGSLYISENARIRKIAGGIITSMAGTGILGFSGDGGPAAGALIDRPSGLTVDLAGNLYFADSGNARVRTISNETITTIAGNGGYKFSGDEEFAASASLQNPTSMAVDSAGNLYIADSSNNRIRKVANGIITTVAGSGSAGFSGDGGPATSASLNAPHGIAIDGVGNLYIADVGNSRVRRVSNGVITTVAGNGASGFSGDGGSATSASLADPIGVAVDGTGSVYIADRGNFRVRKVSDGIITTVSDGENLLVSYDGIALDSVGNLYIADASSDVVRKISDGIITTFAGNINGNGGFSGDGALATDASLNGPHGVAIDRSGNLYISDTGNNRIRKVSNGIITTVAGDGTPGFLGDGGLATKARLYAPLGVAVDITGNIYIADTANDRIREVLTSSPSLGDAVAQRSLALTQGSGGKPVTATLDVDTSITGKNSIGVPGMSYSVFVTSGSPWLSVSPQNGSTPGLLTATANPLNLAPGIYNGTIMISVPLANPVSQTVNVTFMVTAAIPPTLFLDQSHMSFSYATTSVARSQTLIASNTGGGPLNFTASILLNSGLTANWLSITPQNGTATPGNSVSLAVISDPSKLGPGTYTASLTVNGGAAGSVTIPITMTITTNPLVMLLSQAGLTFTTIQNGGTIPPQTFGVLNLGSGTLNWSVQTSTLTGGNWLSATPSTGASTSASPSGAPLVTMSVNPYGLAPGVYYGLVKLISAGAANTPQEVVAVLQVLPAGSDLAPIVQPTSLLFSAAAGVSSPSSQTVAIYDPTGTGKSFRSGIFSSASIETLPTDATIGPDQPTEIVVQPVVNGLAPGTYNGTITLQFSDGRVSTVGVTFVVTSGSSATSRNPHAIPRDSTSCTPTKLIPVLTTLGSGFTVPAGFPEGLTVQVTDDCGNPLSNGRVSVEFSTGQGLKYMQSLNNGRWDVTWNTGSQASAVTLTVHATHPTLPIKGDVQVTGTLGTPQAPPQVLDRGVVSAASFAPTPVAPGSFISIFGSLLSDATSSAQVLPLPTTLNNTTVTLGDQLLPLFYTNNGTQNQINALVPYNTPLNTNLQLLVQRDNTYATPVYVDVAAAQPGVIAYGNTEAVAVDLNNNLVGPSNPAHVGDLITMYCLGLGAVSSTITAGTAAPSSPPAATMETPVVTVGGQNANVYFAGLTPTLAGLYQINFYVPQNSGTGDQVPVVVSTSGQTSVAVNLSVR